MTEIPWNIFFPKYVLESSRELATIFYSEIAQKVGICQDRDDDQPYFKSCPQVAAIFYFLLSIMKELWWAKLELVTWCNSVPFLTSLRASSAFFSFSACLNFSSFLFLLSSFLLASSSRMAFSCSALWKFVDKKDSIIKLNYIIINHGNQIICKE